MHSKKLVLIGLLGLLALVLAGCAGAAGEPGPAGPAGPTGPAGPAGPAATTADLTCSECHNDGNVLAGKVFAWEESLHGTGTSAAYAGGRGSCAACHSGSDFSAMVAAGQDPGTYDGFTAPNITRQDCRACHQVHVTFTGADWALETEDAVTLYAFTDATYDGGEGNLCVNCHQPRRGIEDADAEGNIEVTSTHWGPHHGPQSAMLLGLAGAGEVEGSPSGHYTLVEETCVACHMGEGYDHTFEPDVAACTACHADAEDFDINGLQTEVQAMLDELEEMLIAAGWLDEEGHPAVTAIPAPEAYALWNWIYIAHEDKSLGVHNPTYTKALLEASMEAMGQ